jgi:hypothetical protein
MPDQENPGRVHKTSPTIPFPEAYVYSNASAFACSLFDVHISFAEVLADGESVVPKVGIATTPTRSLPGSELA